jgi:hypothetical protein
MVRKVRGAERELWASVTAPDCWLEWAWADAAFVTLVGGMSVRRSLCIENECGGE